MKREQIREYKLLTIFLISLLIITFTTWAVIEVGFNKNSAKIKPINTVNNLAVGQDENDEDVPLVDENFETYQFKDPFAPLSLANAPQENKQVTSTTTISTPTSTSTDTTTSTDSTSSSSNTSSKFDDNPVIIDFNEGNNPSALIKNKGKTSKVSKGDYIGSLKVININPALKSVELQNGDQIITLIKER